MASLSPSASEGEIIEVEMEKASSAQPVVKDTLVDRPSRKSYSSSSTPDSSIQHDEWRYHSRSRSRSPYRNRSPQGKKRRREDDTPGHDRHDTRRFKVHYEDTRRPRASYADFDRHESRGSRYNKQHGRDKLKDRDQYRRTRSRSRSPFRHKKNESIKENRVQRTEALDSPHKRLNGTQSKSEEARVVELGNRFSDSQAHDNPNMTENETQETASKNTDQSEMETIMNAPLPSIELDEAAQIEERRKRREALKAKLKSQPTPLLAQALHITNSGLSTPKLDEVPETSRSGSPAVISPQSQIAAGSPSALVTADDDNFMNHRAPSQPDDADEPSAVDYDPTVDMQEDLARHDHRFQPDISAGVYDETKEQHDILMPTADNQLEPIGSKKEEFDMFADNDEEEDDDDDMFAPAPVNKTKTSKASKPKQLDASLLDDWDDPDGYYRIILGELLDSRYHVQANLGKGMFSAVVRALDKNTGNLVAIKIIRSNETMKKAGLKEIGILQTLNAADPDNKKHIIYLERSFEHKGHLCMVFENLNINLREVLKKFGRDVGINLKAVRSYAQQMFLGLSLMKKCDILHADLKPDNMLVNDARNLLKICDLGSAGDASENEITPYLVSRFYRAPEIILGMPYDFGIDMWSIGCTLFELYTGKILFTGRNNNQMLRSIMECRGKFSLKMLKKAEFAGMHFEENLMFRSMEKDKATGKDVVRLLNFLRPTRDLKTRLLSAGKALGETDMKDLNLFIDLLDRCLTLNPEKRITPSEALRHPFIHRIKG